MGKNNKKCICDKGCDDEARCKDFWKNLIKKIQWKTEKECVGDEK